MMQTSELRPIVMPHSVVRRARSAILAQLYSMDLVDTFESL